MASKDVASYLSEQQKKCQSHSDLCQDWSKIEEFYNKKLWHQLTLKVQETTKHQYFSQKENLIEFYRRFLSDFEHRINPLALIQIIIPISKQMRDPKEALQFLEKMKDNVKSNDEAIILCMTAIGNIHLQIGDLDKSKILIKETDKLINDLNRVTDVHQRFFELSSNYYKTIIDYANYYKDSLKYLGCIDLSKIPVFEFKERAFNMCLAAILGKNVYNFGELLAHPVLESLKNSDQAWVVDLLYAFNSGNIKKFQELKVFWFKQKDLYDNQPIMRQKISLLCLMEMTFKRPSNHRLMTFGQISQETQLPVNEVEMLIMKALSLGLVKGLIDGVEEKVHMTWVQPRVLDKNQIKGMEERIKSWFLEVEKVEKNVEMRAHDILT